jgi:hypothetical protein
VSGPRWVRSFGTAPCQAVFAFEAPQTSRAKNGALRVTSSLFKENASISALVPLTPQRRRSETRPVTESKAVWAEFEYRLMTNSDDDVLSPIMLPAALCGNNHSREERDLSPQCTRKQPYSVIVPFACRGRGHRLIIQQIPA